MILFIMLALIQVKHFVCDFPLQATGYMYKNKGIYGHPGGILHAAIHGMGTFAVFYWIDPSLASIFAGIDFVVHYHIDWAKMNIGRKYNLQPNNSEWFWILLGLDQLLHQLTYIGFLWGVLK